MYIYIYISRIMNIYIYTYIYYSYRRTITRARAHTHTPKRTNTRMYARMHARTHARTHTHTHTHTHTNANTHTHTHTRIYAGQYRNDVYRFSPAANTWTALSPSGPGPSPRSGMGFAATPDGMLYVFGGRDGGNVGEEGRLIRCICACAYIMNMHTRTRYTL
jgi:hypothetical protein